MGEIAYSWAEMQQLTDNMGARVIAIHQNNEDLGNEIKKLKGSWEGVTSDQMHQAFTKLGGNIDDLRQTIYNLMTQVDQGSQQMKAMEGQLASGWAV
jgi:WXG100 family type VII secretion target